MDERQTISLPSGEFIGKSCWPVFRFWFATTKISSWPNIFAPTRFSVRKGLGALGASQVRIVLSQSRNWLAQYVWSRVMHLGYLHGCNACRSSDVAGQSGRLSIGVSVRTTLMGKYWLLIVVSLLLFNYWLLSISLQHYRLTFTTHSWQTLLGDVSKSKVAVEFGLKKSTRAMPIGWLSWCFQHIPPGLSQM